MTRFPWPSTPAPPVPTTEQREAHQRLPPEIDYDLIGLRAAIRSRCSCGWVGPDSLSEETVMRDHAEHLKAVAAGRAA